MDFTNLLIFRIGNLGDAVVALPALWALRTNFPGAKLTLLSNIDRGNRNYLSARDVLPPVGLIDDWMHYPTNASRIASISSFAVLRSDIARRKFDAIIYLMPRIRTGRQMFRDELFFRFCRVPKMFGFDFFRSQRLSAVIPIPNPTVESESEFLLNLLSSEGLAAIDTPRCTDLLISLQESASAREWFNSSVPHHPAGPLLAVAPGSKWPSKIWHRDRYRDVVARLIQERNCYPIVFGGPEDREIGDWLIASWGRGTNAAGELSVRQSAALLGDCALYLGNDTGTMHLAAACGTPCVAVFAAIDWRNRWQPFGTHNQVFRKSVECEGCHTPNCFNRHKCLKLVSTDEVFDACVRTLAGK